jgi:hypothetical protein
MRYLNYDSESSQCSKTILQAGIFVQACRKQELESSQILGH